MKRMAWMRTIATACIWCCAMQSFGYEVWIGTPSTPKSAATDPAAWQMVAQQAGGLNINLAPGRDTGTGEETANARDWRTILSQYQNRNRNFVPIPRSAFGPTGRNAGKVLTDSVNDRLAHGTRFGYGVDNIMIYDNAVDGANFNWTFDELQAMRTYLDSLGRQDVGIIYNARNYALRVRQFCAHPLVTGVLLEADPAKWFDNAGNRQTLLQWLWTTPSVANKKLIFQVPTNSSTYYQDVRALLVWLYHEQMSPEFMRSNRVVFLLASYNRYAFAPETQSNGRQYSNSMTGTVLSLIEQRALFEGRIRPPTMTDANNTARRPARRRRAPAPRRR